MLFRLLKIEARKNSAFSIYSLKLGSKLCLLYRDNKLAKLQRESDTRIHFKISFPELVMTSKCFFNWSYIFDFANG
jgi:hypothetical protein